MSSPLASSAHRSTVLQAALPGRGNGVTLVQPAAPRARQEQRDRAFAACGGGQEAQVRTVSACPRCLGAHGDIAFRRVARPLRVADWLTAWWWALCPSTGEPVLWASLRPSARGKGPRRGRLR